MTNNCGLKLSAIRPTSSTQLNLAGRVRPVLFFAKRPSSMWFLRQASRGSSPLTPPQSPSPVESPMKAILDFGTRWAQTCWAQIWARFGCGRRRRRRATAGGASENAGEAGGKRPKPASPAGAMLSRCPSALGAGTVGQPDRGAIRRPTSFRRSRSLGTGTRNGHHRSWVWSAKSPRRLYAPASSPHPGAADAAAATGCARLFSDRPCAASRSRSCPTRRRPRRP